MATSSNIAATYQADTVERAAETPETEQPYAALGVKDDEYARIREILGRRPTSSRSEEHTSELQSP